MTFCDLTISDYNVRTCGNDFAGIVGLGIIHITEHPTNENLESADFWDAKITATPAKYWAIRNTRGQYDQIDVIEEEDIYGTTVTGATHTAVIEVENTKDNRDFWDAIQRKNWKICLVNAGGLMFYVDKPVSIYPKIHNAKSPKQIAFFQVELKWYSLSNPEILNAPEGIFTGIFIPSDIGYFDYTLDFAL